MIDVVRLLGKLNLPFRGHREDKNSLNKGVFKEFLEHIAKSDSLLEDHLRNSPGNYTNNCTLLRIFGEAKLCIWVYDISEYKLYSGK